MWVIADDRLLTVAEHGSVDEVCDRLWIESRVTAGDNQRVLVGTVGRLDRDTREVKCVEHVGVAELGRERDTEDVERADRPVCIDGELRDAVFAHQCFEIGPDRIGAFDEHAVKFTEHLIQDLHALVWQADLVGVGVHQAPPDVALSPVFDERVQFAADVLDRLADAHQQRLEPSEHRLSLVARHD